MEAVRTSLPELDDPMLLNRVLTIVPNLRNATDPRSGLVALADAVPVPQVAKLSLTNNQALGNFFEFMTDAFDGLCSPPLPFPNKKINNAIAGSCDRITNDDDSQSMGAVGSPGQKVLTRGFRRASPGRR